MAFQIVSWLETRRSHATEQPNFKMQSSDYEYFTKKLAMFI